MQHLVTNQASVSSYRLSNLFHSVIVVEVYLEALLSGAKVGGISGGGEGGGGAVLEFSVESLVFGHSQVPSLLLGQLLQKFSLVSVKVNEGEHYKVSSLLPLRVTGSSHHNKWVQYVSQVI